jgi:cellobionic acid phosphorylase
VYRCFIEGLCGLRGVREGLKIAPKMPSDWDEMKVRREFRGAVFDVEIQRGDVKDFKVVVDGEELGGCVVKDVAAGKMYKVQVQVPRAKKSGVNGISNGTKSNGGLTNGNGTNGTK